MAITKSNVKALHADLQATLEAFAAKHNLSVSPFNMTYSPTGFKFACQMGDKSEIGDADPILAINTRKFGNWYDLKVEDIGKEFTFNGVKVKFLGMKNKTHAIYSKPDGRRFWSDAMMFASGVGRKPLDLNRGTKFDRERA